MPLKFCLSLQKTDLWKVLGRGGGLVVSVPAFYSDDPSSNPAGYLINFLYKKTKINEKLAVVGPFKKKNIRGTKHL